MAFETAVNRRICVTASGRLGVGAAFSSCDKAYVYIIIVAYQSIESKQKKVNLLGLHTPKSLY